MSLSINSLIVSPLIGRKNALMAIQKNLIEAILATSETCGTTH